MIPPTVRFAVYLAAAVVAGLSVLFAVAAWRLAAGPVSLRPLAPYLEQAVSEAVGGLGVRFSDTILSWAARDQTLEVRAVGVDLFNDGGDVVRLPEISLALSGRALLRGMVAPASIDLIAPEMTLVRNADGSFDTTLGIANDGWFDAMVDELLQPPDRTRPTGHLERISLLNADLTLNDLPTGTTWRAPGADIVMLRKSPGLVIDLAGTFFLGGAAIELGVTAQYDTATTETVIDAEYSGLRPNQFASPLGLSWLHAVHAELAGTVAFTLYGFSAVSMVDFEARSGRGFLDLPQYFEPPLRFDDALVRGSADGTGPVHIDDFDVHAGPTAGQFRGVVGLGEAGVAIRGSGGVTNLSAAAIPGYWPFRVNPKARAWFAEHVPKGVVEDATFSVDMPPEVFLGERFPDDMIDAAFTFSGGAVRYLPKFPMVTDVMGHGRLTGARLELSVDSAASGDLRLSEGEVVLQGLNTPQSVAEIAFVGRGDLRRTLELLDHEPLILARKMNIRPATVEGQVAARARFEFPVHTHLLPAEIAYRAAANVRGAAVPKVLDGYDITDGDLQIRVVNGRVEGTGPIDLNGVPMDLVWRRDVGLGTPTQLFLSGRFDAADRAALGVPAMPFLDGAVAAELRLDPDGGARRMEVEVDLRDSHLSFPEIRWKKTVGVPGSARFVAVREADGGIGLYDLEVRAADLEARGNIQLSVDGAVQAARFDKLRYGLTEMSADAKIASDGRLALKLDGPLFDFRPYADDLFDFSTPSELPPLSIEARFDRLIVGDDLQLQQVNVEGANDGAGWERLSVGGEFTPGEALTLSLTGRDGGRRLDIATADAGTFLRTLGYFENAVGGTLRLIADVHDDEPGSPMRGRVRVDGFHLVGVPVLAQILSLASLTGIVDTLGGDGVSFIRFEAPFALADEVLSIGDARAVGSALGITVTGTVDRHAGEVDLLGTMIPAYTINSLLGNIPILGTLLVGKEGEGVFALSYRVRGPVENPRVTVNPLAALAPGFLRNFVVGLEEVEGSTDTLPPATGGAGAGGAAGGAD